MAEGYDSPPYHEEDTRKGLISDQEEGIEKDIAIKKKSSREKDENFHLRQEQIQAYRKKVTKEERARRSKLRRGEEITPESESPQKKKKVSFLSSESPSKE